LFSCRARLSLEGEIEENPVTHLKSYEDSKKNLLLLRSWLIEKEELGKH
jgi:hypothetical protein